MTRREEISIIIQRYNYQKNLAELEKALAYVVELSDGKLTTIDSLLETALNGEPNKEKPAEPQKPAPKKKKKR